MNRIGARIKNLRETFSLPQCEVATAANISTQYLSQLEKGGNKKPDEAILRKISEYFSSTLPWVRDGIGWSFVPVNSFQALTFAYKSIDRKPTEVGIISYEDEYLGRPKGFIFVWNDFSMSMAGTRTRSGYRGGAPSNYRDILIKIYNSGIQILRHKELLFSDDKFNFDLMKINPENLKMNTRDSKSIIELECKFLHPSSEEDEDPLLLLKKLENLIRKKSF